MCELFGVSSAVDICVDPEMKEFISHSVEHRHGWGLAVLLGNYISLEKEPVQASKSTYLKERLKSGIIVKNMIAHIRLATFGIMSYENSHPFIKRDQTGRVWLLAHNGTIFDSTVLNPYFASQSGKTDSEHILAYLVDQVNDRQKKLGREMTIEERFALLEQLVRELAPHNKLNLLLYDGEVIYTHSNYRNSLHVYQTEDTAMFATVPLSDHAWEELPFMTLCAYKDGRRILQGTGHGSEYVDNERDMKYLFANFSSL